MSRQKSYKLTVGYFTFYALLALLSLILLSGDLTTQRKVVGISFIVLGGALVLLIAGSKKLHEVDRIHQTYPLSLRSLNVDRTQIFPQYNVPPAPDQSCTIRFGCAPLLDCCFPMLLRELDPKLWSFLARTHGVNIQFVLKSFNSLFGSVQDGSSDVVIASAVAVDQATYSNIGRTARNPNAPLAMLPVLQQFNAYYMFARRHLVEIYFEKKGFQNALSQTKLANSNVSLHSLLNKPAGVGQLRTIISMMDDAKINVETGADLEAAVITYWEGVTQNLNHRRLPSGLQRVSHKTIVESFDEFYNTSELSLYIGGLAQTAFLLQNCEPKNEFVLIAGPHDIQADNVNSFVCSKAFREKYSGELLRLYGWWFDVVNSFRRDLLFHDAGRIRLKELVLRGIPDHDGTYVSLLPSGSSEKVVDQLLRFLMVDKLGDVTDPASQIGTFLLPNLYSAQEVRSVVVEKLRRNDVVIDLLRSDGVMLKDFGSDIDQHARA